MEMTKVESSNIKSVGWLNEELYVEYSGGIYIYEKVSKELFTKLLAAESKGHFMNEEIKGKYNYRKAGK